MRERLTAAFVVLALVVLASAAFIVRVATDDERAVREHDEVMQLAVAVSAGLSGLSDDAGAPAVDREALEPFAHGDVRLTYQAPGAPTVVVGGDALEEGEDVANASAPVQGGGRLSVTRATDNAAVGPLGDDYVKIAGTCALLALAAGATGYAMARRISDPFRRLAAAAAALGRGRFDLELPRGGVPEARAIASALEQSAGQLRERLERERAFGQHTSHVLRTPLTRLRLRLEGLLTDPELSPDAQEAARACLEAVADLDEVTGELVEIGGRGVLVAGAAVPLRELATQIAHRWARRLDARGRAMSAAVDGDLELAFTPGPVEQVLDLLLDGVLADETGSVRLVFEGVDGRLRVDLLCGRPDGSRGAPASPVEDRVATVVDALGGTVERPVDADLLRLRLPRR
jgi:signal transduction histidine kinase